MSVDSHFIDEETKAWRGEQSASEQGQEVLGSEFKGGSEAQNPDS